MDTNENFRKSKILRLVLKIAYTVIYFWKAHNMSSKYKKNI